MAFGPTVALALDSYIFASLVSRRRGKKATWHTRRAIHTKKSTFTLQAQSGPTYENARRAGTELAGVDGKARSRSDRARNTATPTATRKFLRNKEFRWGKETNGG